MGGSAAPASLGTLSGVIVPTCENMWGVLIFLRFFFVVGHAGVGQALLIVAISFSSSFFTTMSLSAMATNGPVEAGGAYFIISRALGHKLGGAVGTTYFFGLSLLAVLEVLGAVEVMLYVDPSLYMGMGAEGAVRVWAVLLTSALALMVHGGMKLVSQLGLFFAAVVGLTLASYYAGLIAAPMSGAPDSVTGLTTSTLRDNWGSDYTEGVTFSDVLSVFFPCFTGILAGANRSQALKKPEVSIPWGTLSAICISACMYSSYMIMWGAVADRAFLKGGPQAAYTAGHRRALLAGGGGESMSVVSEIAWPLALPTQIGIVIASLSQALQCLISAPRILNAIAADGTVPFLQRAAPLNDAGEPTMALVMTTGFCLVASMIGSLDLVAPLLSICFLSAYAALNFSTFALGLTKAPSWRPTWRYFHWSLGLAGFIVCTTLAFVIKWYFALVAVALLGALVAYIESSQVQVDWGSALGGIRLDLATSAMLDLAHERRHSTNWRPQLLCLPSWPSNENASESGDKLLSVASQLKKGRGLCVAAEIEEGHLATERGLAKRVSATRERLEERLAAANVRGFAHCLVAPEYRAGTTFAIQGLGFGGLEPNTVLLGWPKESAAVEGAEDDDAAEDDETRRAKTLVETVCECTAAEKAVLLCVGLDAFPTSDERLTGFLDVWWVVHDGGLLLMIAHLLLRHKTWEKCKLRVHTVVQRAQDPEAMRRSLVDVLETFRINAEVSVVEAGDDADMYAYTHDWTMRKEQAELFRRELLQAQAGGSGVRTHDGLSSLTGSATHSGAETPERNASGASTPPDPRTRSPTRPPGSPENDSRDASQREGAPSKASSMKHAFPSEIDMLVAHADVEGEETMDIRHLRRNSMAPGEANPMAQGHASLASIFDMAAVATKPEEKAGTKESETNGGSLSPIPGTPTGEVRVRVRDEEDGEPSGVKSDEVRVAIGDSGDGGSETAPPTAEILSPKPRTKKAVSFGAEDVTRTYSPRPLTPVVPEATTSWVTDASSAEALNRIIREKSGDARLVIVNLPDPDAIVMANPTAYAKYTEQIVDGLERVIFVHGTGREVYTSQ
jgi:amino acid transporter